MLYDLLVPLAKYHSAFNVFRYITFRAAMATVTALCISFVLGPWLIERLRQLQHGGETIREDTPARHRSKAGTPTMGGLVILAAILASTDLWTQLYNRYVWVLLLATTGLGLIGLQDDRTKVKTGRGISAKRKFGAQIALVGALMGWLYFWPPDGFTTGMVVPFFKGWLLALGWAWIPFAILVIVGASNAVNLTDGLDGLAIMPVVMVGSALGVFAYVTGSSVYSRYLLFPYIPGSGELLIFCAAMAGAGLAFLWFNTHPAQVFMGDVGALSLGGALGTIAVITRQEIVLGIMGGVFVAEALSVMLQVSWFKFTKAKFGSGRRIFKMAPLHHHFEKSGWKETQVVVRFWIITMLLCLVGLASLKLR